MQNKNHCWEQVVLVLLVFGGMLLSADAFAYIDPNAGGMLFQLLFPLLIAVAGAWAIFREKLKKFWSLLFRRRTSDD